MAGLSALLSQVLVAFTTEFDNEFERRMPHRTSLLGSEGEGRSHPWLASQVMWANLMQYVPAEGITVGELERVARTKSLCLTGMQRWRYVTVSRERGKRRVADMVVRPTAGGLRAQEGWRPLGGIIEERWAGRFGGGEIERLRRALWAIVDQFEVELPDYLPVVGYGLFASVVPGKREEGAATGRSLSGLVSKALICMTLEFEKEQDVSLAVSANVLRVLNEEGVPVRALPDLSGVSKEGIQMALGFLEKRGYVSVETDRTKLALLTAKGVEARLEYFRRWRSISEGWEARYGKAAVRELREALEGLVGDPDARPSPLLLRIRPYEGGWRSKVRQAPVLPHYPLVLHRGGYPDGS